MKPEKPTLTASLVEISQYAILALFIMYALGFIIWRSYLASYGISSVGFFQVEYISAAMCYLVIIFVFSICPCALLNLIISESNGQPIKKESALQLFILWSAIFFFTKTLYFPKVIFVDSYLLIWLSFVWLFFCQILFKLKKSPKFLTPKIASLILLSSSCAFIVLSEVIKKNSSLHVLIFHAPFLVLLSDCTMGAAFSQSWNKMGRQAKSLVAIICVLFFIELLQFFSSIHYPNIPRHLGGGKPDIAFVKFSKESEHLAFSFGLVAAANHPQLNGFWGPITVLLKTDSEILFINSAESKIDDYISYKVSQESPIRGSNGEIILGEGGTEIYGEPTISTVNEYNRVKLTAKQVRSELIDAIVYAKASASTLTNAPAVQ